MIREFISNIFFNTALGNGFYNELNQAGFLYMSLISVIAIIIFRYSEKINLKVLYFFCFFFSAVTTLNVLRYMPYGGDAKIYCELTDYSQTSDVSIYNTTLKYTFNYPPIFENIFTRLCAFNYVDNLSLIHI